MTYALYTECHDAAGEPMLISIPDEHLEVARAFFAASQKFHDEQNFDEFLVAVDSGDAQRYAEARKPYEQYDQAREKMFKVGLFDSKWDYRTHWTHLIPESEARKMYDEQELRLQSINPDYDM